MSGGSSLKLLDTSQLKDRIQTHEHKLGARKKNTGQDRQTFNGDVWLKQSKRSCRFTSLHDKVSHFQEPWCVFSLTINQLQTQVKEGHM